jgi:imidazolonepropionase-like amidohydrolase
MEARIVAVLAVAALCACGGQSEPVEVTGDYVFQGVNIIPMTGAGVMEGYIVGVTDGVITDIVAADSAVIVGEPVVIDSAGGYLIPGLADMHVHFNSTTDALLYVANGVTLIRNMWGSRSHRWLREQYASGEKLGPELWTTGPLMDGDPPYHEGSLVVTTAEEARESVLAQIAEGYDAIKVYSRLSVEAYDSILETAHANDFPVWGHVPHAVDVIYAAEAGQESAEHLFEYSIGGDLSAEIAATVEHGMWNCPTLTALDHYYRLDEIRESEIEGLEYVHPSLLDFWEAFTPPPEWGLPEPVQEYSSATFELHQAGALLLVGTDVSNPYVIAGFALHNELRLMVEAGFTPHEALILATRNAAEFVGALDRLGTVEVGKEADLVLLRQNPLADISRTGDRAGVMMDGIWYSEETLQEMLDELVESYPSR